MKRDVEKQCKYKPVSPTRNSAFVQTNGRQTGRRRPPIWMRSASFVPNKAERGGVEGAVEWRGVSGLEIFR